VKLLGEGGYGSGTGAGQKPGSYFIKKSTMNTAAIRLTVPGASMEGGGVDCQAGNTDDGIRVEANNCDLKNTWTNGAGQDGTRIGIDAAGANCNSVTLHSVRNFGAGRHNLHIHDGSINANACTVLNPTCIGAAQHGLYNNNGSETTVIGGTFETNGGYGRYFNGGDSSVVEGGDAEANTTGDLFIAAACTNMKYDVRSGEVIVDMTRAIGSAVITTSRSRPYSVWRENELNWPCILSGSTTGAKAVTAITQAAGTATATIVGHGFVANDSFLLQQLTTNHIADHPWGGCYKVTAVVDVDHITFACNANLPTPAAIGAGINAWVGYPVGSVASGAWRLDGNWCRLTTQLTVDTGAKNAGVTGTLRLMGLPFRIGSPSTAALFGSFFANMNVFQLAAFGGLNFHSFDFYRTPPLTAGAGAFAAIPVADFVVNANAIVSFSASWKIG
jgi:hypothetical protein